MGKYKNKLGLQGIPRIKEIIPQDIGLFFGLFYEGDDEFIHFADTLKEWKRQRISLADFIEDEAHREAVLRDLYHLRDSIALELRDAMTRQGQPMAYEGHRYFERREYFLRETFPYEEGRLLSWEPPIEREDIFHFELLKGFCVLTRQHGAVTKLRLQLQESGIFSIGWKQAGDVGEEVEPIEKEFRIDSLKTAVIVPIKPPKRSGTIFILNHTRKATERVPV